MILSTFVMITFIATFLTLIDWLDEEAAFMGKETPA